MNFRRTTGMGAWIFVFGGVLAGGAFVARAADDKNADGANTSGKTAGAKNGGGLHWSRTDGAPPQSPLGGPVLNQQAPGTPQAYAPANNGAPAPYDKGRQSLRVVDSGPTPDADAELRGREARQQRREESLRHLMASFGFAETATQDALIAYINSEEQARQTVRRQGRQLMQALRAGNVPEDDMRALLEEFRAATQADKARHAAAEAALDAQIGYSKNPRLEAMLLMCGLLGDGPLVVTLNVAPPLDRSSNAGRMDAGRVDAGFKDSWLRDGLRLDDQQRAALTQRFDGNNNRRLDPDERANVRTWVQALISTSLGLQPPTIVTVDKTPGDNDPGVLLNTMPTTVLAGAPMGMEPEPNLSLNAVKAPTNGATPVAITSVKDASQANGAQSSAGAAGQAQNKAALEVIPKWF